MGRGVKKKEKKNAKKLPALHPYRTGSMHPTA
jgi:hypothetical protein